MKKTFQTLAAGATALLLATGCSDYVHTSCTSENGSGTISNGLDSWEVALTKPNGTQVYYSRGTETQRSGTTIITKFCATGENPTKLREELKSSGEYSCVSANGDRHAYVKEKLTGTLISDEKGNEALMQKPFIVLAKTARDYCVIGPQSYVTSAP